MANWASVRFSRGRLQRQLFSSWADCSGSHISFYLQLVMNQSILYSKPPPTWTHSAQHNLRYTLRLPQIPQKNKLYFCSIFSFLSPVIDSTVRRYVRTVRPDGRTGNNKTLAYMRIILMPSIASRTHRWTITTRTEIALPYTHLQNSFFFYHVSVFWLSLHHLTRCASRIGRLSFIGVQLNGFVQILLFINYVRLRVYKCTK